MAIQTMPKWATEAQGTSIISKLDAIAADVRDIKGVQITVEARAYDVTTGLPIAVTGQIVYLYEGDSTGPQLLVQQFAYNGQPVAFKVRRGFHYHIKMSSTLAGHYSPSEHYGIAGETDVSVVVTYQDIRTVSTFAAVKAVLDEIKANNPEDSLDELAAKGRTALVDENKVTRINDTWTAEDGTVYDDPMLVVDVRVYKSAEDGQFHVGAKCQREFATLHRIQFDAPEQQEADKTTETTMDGDLFYRGYGAVYSTTKSYAVNNFCSHEGSIYKCTAATSGEWDPSKWQLQTSFQSGALVKITTVAGSPIPYDDYQCVYKNKYDNNNVIVSGHNRYEYSAWHQYLTSENTSKGGWWTRQHAGQMPPNTLSETRGYRAGCSQTLLDAARKVEVQCAANTVSDGGGYYSVSASLFLSSGTEYNGDVNANEGDVNKYWIDRMGGKVKDNSADPGRIQKAVDDHSQSAGGVTVWSRSAVRVGSNSVWHVYSSGQAYGISASTQCAGCPACVIY